MTEVDSTPVVLGLYRRDVPEMELLRALLNWLKEYSSLVLPFCPQPSGEQSKELLRIIHLAEFMRQAQEQLSPGELALRLIKALPALPEPPRLDEALIERLVAANDFFPDHVRLQCFHVPYCPVTVGYAEPLPDDFHESGRRLVQVAAAPVDSWWSKVPPGAELPFRRVEPWELPQYLMKELEGFLLHLGCQVAFDYATIQYGRELPGLATLQRSTDPEDFDRLYMRMPASETNEFVSKFDDARNWLLEPLRGMGPFGSSTLGLAVKLRDAGEPLSQRARAVLEALHTYFAARFQ